VITASRAEQARPILITWLLTNALFTVLDSISKRTTFGARDISTQRATTARQDAARK
jgi:hypothetical protein